MKIAWLFPGQGSQTVGMGKLLHERSTAARQTFEEADDVLGFSLSRLCFEGPSDELTLTENAQPALVTVSIAALRAARELLPEFPAPAFAAGHSLGEFSALVASGAVSFTRALQLVRLRGRAMQAAVPSGQGGMVAIMGATEPEVAELCAEARGADVLSPANFNCPGQIVLAGHSAALARATALAKERRMRAIVLKVSAPFHCALMEPAAAQLDLALSDVKFDEFAFPVLSNVEGRPNSDPARLRELLFRQVCGTVRWHQSLSWLAADGVTHALEIGPGKVLAGLNKKTIPQVRSSSVCDPDQILEIPAFINE